MFRPTPTSRLLATATAFAALAASCGEPDAEPDQGPDPSRAVAATAPEGRGTASERSAATGELGSGELGSDELGSDELGAGAGSSASGRESGRPQRLEGLDLSNIVLPGANSPLATKARPDLQPTVDAKLVVEGEDRARFGTINEGDHDQHVFDLVVEGDVPINVYDKKSTCGCTIGRLELVAPDGGTTEYTTGMDVPPDSKLRVHGELRTEGKRGPQEHTITLRHNGSNRATMLHFEAEVLPTFEMKPNQYFNFGDMFVNESRTGEIAITSPVLERFGLEIDRTFGMPDYMQVALEPVDPHDDGRAGTWRVTATLGPGAPEGLAGQQSLTVILRSDVPIPDAAPMPNGEPRMRTLNLYVYARVKSLVHASPSYVSFGAISAGAEAKREFRIEFADDAFEVDIERLRDVRFEARNPNDQAFYDDLFGSSVEWADDGSGAVVVRTWFDRWPEDRVGPFGGDIVLDVGHPTAPTVKVPFSGVCRQITQGTRAR